MHVLFSYVAMAGQGAHAPLWRSTVYELGQTQVKDDVEKTRLVLLHVQTFVELLK
jgi:hypothetical protein